MWDRNFQLAFWSAAIYLPILIYDNPTDPFVGWSYVAVACSAVGALGGTRLPPSPPRTLSMEAADHLPRLHTRTCCRRARGAVDQVHRLHPQDHRHHRLGLGLGLG